MDLPVETLCNHILSQIPKDEIVCNVTQLGTTLLYLALNTSKITIISFYNYSSVGGMSIKIRIYEHHLHRGDDFSIQDPLLKPLLRSFNTSLNTAEKGKDMNKVKRKMLCKTVTISTKQHVELKELIRRTKDMLNWNLRQKEWKLVWVNGAAPQEVLKILMSYLFLIDQIKSVEYMIGVSEDETDDDSNKQHLKQTTRSIC